MGSFYNKIKKICEENEKVAMFVDMDGTVAEYNIYPDNFITVDSKGLFDESKPIKPVIEALEEVDKIENLDIYILTLCKSKIILEEKEFWLRKNMPFIKKENYIIICRENGDYNDENREYIKALKIKEKLSQYNYAIMVDDEHTILRRTIKELGESGTAFHVSSTMV